MPRSTASPATSAKTATRPPRGRRSISRCSAACSRACRKAALLRRSRSLAGPNPASQERDVASGGCEPPGCVFTGGLTPPARQEDTTGGLTPPARQKKETPMPSLEEQLLATLNRKNYQPLKPKALARQLHVGGGDYNHFRRVLRDLIQQGRIEIGKNQTVRIVPPHGTVAGVYRRTGTGKGYVRPHPVEGRAGPEVLIHEE